MNSFKTDNRIVMTLDAGGTNFVFSAMQRGEEIVEHVAMPANGHDLQLCLQTIVNGFEQVKSKLKQEPSAISFAFPGPADFPNGIIGDLNNLSGFRGGVALGPMLEEHFGIPVFINNDGDLYAYGEALAGVLQEMNIELSQNGSSKRYHNLIGITLGTGFGAGIVIKEHLLIGDNAAAAEVCMLSNRNHPESRAEEGVSTRSIQITYKELTNTDEHLMPKDIYDIAMGKKDGNVEAAKKAFEFFGKSLGDSIANLITVIDGVVVIGGGITGAKDLYMPAVMKEVNNAFIDRKGNTIYRLVQKAFDYSNPEEKEMFLKKHSVEVAIPGSDKTVVYNSFSRTAIAHSKIGASRAIALGAFTFALNSLDNK